jgi:hypothetical protein
MFRVTPERTVGTEEHSPLAKVVMTMTAQTYRTSTSPEPVTYLELAGRIDWRESGSSAGVDDFAGSCYYPFEPQDLPRAA